MSKCLYCYKDTDSGDFHFNCAKKIFGSNIPPDLPYSIEEIEELAKNVLARSIAVPGVQAKLSLSIEKQNDTDNSKDDRDQARFTIVGLWGNYILKPPAESYPYICEAEHCTMYLAKTLKIPTVPHSLIRLKSGELSYITRRIDRDQKLSKKLHMEDFCQLSQKPTEQKYKGSLESAGKIIKMHSANGGFDLVVFFELLVFCFLTCNADMHLKNFSLVENALGENVLAPAYDLLNTRLFIPEKDDSEESALSLSGKKSRLRRSDFQAFAENIGLTQKQTDNVFRKFSRNIKKIEPLVRRSFMPVKMQDEYIALFSRRAERLELV